MLRTNLLLLLAGCPLLTPPGDDPPVGEECMGLSPGSVLPLASIPGGTEGVAVRQDGRLFVAGSDTVWSIAADGTASAFATVPSPVGMAAWNDGLVVASSDDGLGSGGGAVYVVAEDGAVSLLAVGLEYPNFLTVTPWGSILVSDDFDTRIREIDETGLPTDWLRDIVSPNGMAVAQDGSGLWVASTIANPPPLTWVPFAGQNAGVPVRVWEFPTGTAPDGVALDADGTLYTALNLTGEIARYTDAEGASIFAAGLENPASIAFGLGGDWNPCQAVVTSLTGDTLSLLDVGVPGGLLWL